MSKDEFIAGLRPDVVIPNVGPSGRALSLSEAMAIRPPAPVEVIHIHKPKKKPVQIWCPLCEFSFERTTVAAARAWAQAHNESKHDAVCVIRDDTLRRQA